MLGSWGATLPFVVILLCPGTSGGQYTAEVDVDGQLGNGPDTVAVAMGQEILTDVWIHGPGLLSLFGVTVCEFDSYLDWLSAGVNSPDGWGPLGGGFPPPGCGTLSAMDIPPSSEPLGLPWRAGWVRYVAAVDNSIAQIAVQLDYSGWISTGGASGLLDGYVGAVVQIGSTGIEQSSWGAIKTLFR